MAHHYISGTSIPSGVSIVQAFRWSVVQGASDTVLILDLLDGTQLMLLGTGFILDEGDVPAAGTVTGMVRYDATDGIALEYIGDIAIDLADMAEWSGSDFEEALFSGSNMLFGGDLADVIRGAGLADVVFSGIGNDVITSGAGNDEIHAGDGDDSISSDGGSDYIEAGAGNDTVDGGDDADGIFGGDGDDSLNGGTGNDGLIGGDGNDTINGDAGSDFLDGGVGNDTLDGGGDSDGIFGGDGDDSLKGGTGNDGLIGGDGNDTIDGDAGNDYAEGGAGNDLLSGGEDGDALFGGGGDDVLIGGSGGDALVGDEGNDTIDGDSGSDYIDGGTGNDSLTGGTDADGIFGGDGHDTLSGGEGNDGLIAGEGNDSLDGGTGDDYLEGNEGNDDLSGGDGNDALFGGDGADSLVGGTGNDGLVGGAGNDTIDGGEGIDRVNFSGNRADYDITYDSATQTFTVIDLRDGSPDATDIVTGIEAALFADRLIDMTSPDDLLGRAPIGITLGTMSLLSEAVAFGGNIGLAYDPANPAYGLVVVGQLSATDQDIDDEFTFAISDQGSDYFEIVSGNLLAVKSGATIDYELTPTIVVPITVTDAFGHSFQQDVTVSVIDYEGSNTQSAEDAEVFDGTSEEDLLVGGPGDTVYGWAGDDTITGDGGVQLLIGDDGADSISAGGGDDSLNGWVGNDTLDGGEGNDILAGSFGNDTIDGGQGDSDVLFLSGDRADYSIVYSGEDPFWIVTDLREGSPDGTDRITGIEFIDFSGTLVPLTEYMGPLSITVSGSGNLNELVADGGTISVSFDPSNPPTTVATLSAWSPDPLDTFTYSLAGPGAAFFEVVDNEVRVKADAVIDYETTPAIITYVTATDTSGLTHETTMTIQVIDFQGAYNGIDETIEEIRGTSEEDNIVLGAFDTAIGGAGDDTMSGTASNSWLFANGGQGNDEISVLAIDTAGMNANTTANGGDNEDRITVTANGRLASAFGVGGAGNDTITATAGNTLSHDDPALGGYTVADGGEGDDAITFTLRQEASGSVDGGIGQDTITATTSDSFYGFYIDGGEGHDSITGTFTSSIDGFVTGGSGNDTISASSSGVLDNFWQTAAFIDVDGNGGDDLISILAHNLGQAEATGGDGNDTINVDATDRGRATVDGGEGSDTISAETSDNAGFVVANGGVGNDSLTGTILDSSALQLHGNEGDDTITGTASGSRFDSYDGLVLGSHIHAFGGDGNDLITLTGTNLGEIAAYGGIGNDTINATVDDAAQLTAINGNEGDDLITLTTNGGEHDPWDSAAGGAGNDTILGGNGSETLRGDEGDDSLSGGGGNDRLEGWFGNDMIDGGAGIDTAIYASNMSDYAIVHDPETGTIGVTDMREVSPEGADILTSVERFAFLDTTLSIGSAFAALGSHRVNERVFDGGSIGTAYNPAVAQPIVAEFTPQTHDAEDVTYGLSGPGAAYFEIFDGNKLRVRSDAPTIDYEMTRSIVVTVTMTVNGVGALTPQDILIDVGNYRGQYHDVINGNGNDTIIGTSEEDGIHAGTGDSAYGGTGNDFIDLGLSSGSAQSFGEDGDDRLTGSVTDAQARMDGGAGNDSLRINVTGSVNLGNAIVHGYGDEGNDTIIASADGAAIVQAYGDAGNDSNPRKLGWGAS